MDLARKDVEVDAVQRPHTRERLRDPAQREQGRRRRAGGCAVSWSWRGGLWFGHAPFPSTVTIPPKGPESREDLSSACACNESPCRLNCQARTQKGGMANWPSRLHEHATPAFRGTPAGCPPTSRMPPRSSAPAASIPRPIASVPSRWSRAKYRRTSASAARSSPGILDQALQQLQLVGRSRAFLRDGRGRNIVVHPLQQRDHLPVRLLPLFDHLGDRHRLGL